MCTAGQALFQYNITMELEKRIIRRQEVWILVWVLPLMSYETLGESLNLSGLHVSNRGKICSLTYLRMVERANEIIDVWCYKVKSTLQMLHDGIFIIFSVSLYIFFSLTLDNHSSTEFHWFFLWNVFQIHPLFFVLNAYVLVQGLINPYQNDCNKLLFFSNPSYLSLN